MLFNILDINAKYLHEYAMLMSHDAATGYLHRDHIVADWAITQANDLTGQLNCGARSFDYRPYYKDNNVYAHHGGVKININLKDSLNEVLLWLKSNKNELVMFYINKCEGDDGCLDATKQIFNENNIYSITECSQLNTLTMNDIMLKSVINKNNKNEGNIFVLYDCVEEEYDSKINCYSKDFTCYDSWPSNTSNIPWNNMITYAINTTDINRNHGAKYTPWMLQTHWQSTAASITSGTLHKSSILLDEEKSKMNNWVSESINNNLFPTLNIVEVDNICDNGINIYHAIQKYNKNH